MRKKIVILLIFISAFFLNVSFSGAVPCAPGARCYDNQTNSCKYCSGSNKYSGGAGYVKGGILEGICDIRNTSNCEMDAACWTSEGVFSSTAGSQSATAVDCCKTADCPKGGSIGYICQNNKCVDWGLGTINHTTPIVKPTAIMEDPTATSVTGKGTTTNGAKITNIKIYKDTSGCGSDPRVHLDGCTGMILSEGGGSQSGNIWTKTFNFAGTVTKETKYSVKVQDSNGVWSSCASKIFATTTGAEPASGFTTGIDTSKGGDVFTCSGVVPNGTTKIMCPSSASKKSAVQNSWTSVGTSESDCGDMSRCEYYTIGVTTNPVISPTPSDPTAPSCTATGTGNNPITSGESATVKLTAKNADKIGWLCYNFDCTGSTCNYVKDYTVKNTLTTDKLGANGSISTTMVYTNNDSSIKVRRCTFYVSNSTTGKTGECTNSVAVRPKESVAETKCGYANGMEFDSEVGAIENKLGGYSLCNDGVPINSSDKGWSTSLSNNYSKQIKWVCGAGLDVYDCKAYVKNTENETVETPIKEDPIVTRDVLNLCGPAGSKDKGATEAYYTADVNPAEFRGDFCQTGSVIEGEEPSFPAMDGDAIWTCKNTTTLETQPCYAHRNTTTQNNNTGTVVTTNNPSPSADIYGKCGNAMGLYSSGNATFRQPFCEVGKVELFASDKYATGTDLNLKGVTSFLKLANGELATRMKWTCIGGSSTRGLTPDLMNRTCEAFWRTPGKCNEAAENKIYAYNTDKISDSNTLCEKGNPSPVNPAFRQEDNGIWYAQWTCLGEGDRAGIDSCSATRGVDPNASNNNNYY